ncbi:MAG: hypothetical protein A3C08_02085 [Candidatus Taylorbacteria bacterium RIFCSPHIGHO2_02_FULL_47_18]|uniref:Pilus assembly protein PilO n=1 Tax=Candidatus Taylorbacteria bacterium RIFCSPLOWO2_01_FULL_48_100 TaxID=1802322 RepID=A0A1G2NF01_9BACT|nr:MAG: hypothetical protein A2670_02675 [Candidatus Taylorbacteria bacterium RIFCSPHIGHO2_01_FULL_48_38]OHA28528.1 MAG: hypothetical protein A3C08_02085 [Candidatus Taylorbacteria bacterium RIFCSPHIGHO2_02_FULL_47_18]OHA34665.1 MAG: hypothetical protein A2938_00250 [Candidatus Taylorbacteria bacterium RIFCSPLOWO2_01_FULL_48_100]OHA40755.1 MAG: hypothetical protein A3J31_00380 [Candidatus Taylorbacteria bacterium RIFCSPLOWO2_02_FULL_48_16]OHA45383.1 MAG: hypothetical protein A3H13_01055 [Candid
MYGKLLIPILFLALSASVSAWFTKPLWNEVTGAAEFSDKSIAELRADEVVYGDAFSKMREIELARTGLAAKYNAVSEENRVRLQKVAPDTIDSVRLILDIENVARTHGLKLRSVSASASASPSGGRRAEENGYEPVLFSFSALGAYDKFVPFLADLERSVRLSDIVGVDFESKNSSDYVYGITLRTYKLRDNI